MDGQRITVAQVVASGEGDTGSAVQDRRFRRGTPAKGGMGAMPGMAPVF